MTWVLVLMLSGTPGVAITTVPGYESEVACTSALLTYAQRAGKIAWGYCIPGPKISK